MTIIFFVIVNKLIVSDEGVFFVMSPLLMYFELFHYDEDGGLERRLE